MGISLLETFVSGQNPIDGKPQMMNPHEINLIVHIWLVVWNINYIVHEE